jgi:hypothetical protein
MKKMLVLLVVLGFAGIAGAASIGVNMGTDQGGSLGSSEWAGVVSQANWNNASGSGGSASNLNDNSGGGNVVDVEWSSHNTWHTYGNPGYGDVPTAPDGKLMYGYLDATYNNVQHPTVTLSDIPYAQYDVYVYLGTDNGATRGKVTIGTTEYYFTTMGFESFSAYALTTDTDGSVNPSANYAKFSNLTGSSVTVTTSTTYDEWQGNPAGGILGVQIVEVPEPVTMTLLGLGGLALIRRKR